MKETNIIYTKYFDLRNPEDIERHYKKRNNAKRAAKLGMFFSFHLLVWFLYILLTYVKI